MDKILVTGVAGFIGSNLALELLNNEKNIVFGIDNFSSSSMSNLYPLLKNDRFHFIEHNLVNKILLNADYIYHLAGCGDGKNYNENKFDFMIEQIEIIKNVIDFTKINGAKLVLTTQNKNYSKINENNFKFYDTLNMIESLVLELVDNNKISATFAKLDYVYGENMRLEDERFIPKTIINATKNINIELEYDESFYFTYVQDVVKNLIKTMNSYSSNPIVDICNQNLYLKSDIIRLIFNCLKSNSKLTIKTHEQYHPNYSPKNILLDNGVELNCKTPVLDGIIKTVQHFKLMHFS